MSLSRDSRQERKWKAARRAEFALKQRFERIDFEEDILLPEIEAMKAGKSFASLPAGSVFEFVIEDVSANPAQTTPSDSGE